MTRHPPRRIRSFKSIIEKRRIAHHCIIKSFPRVIICERLHWRAEHLHPIGKWRISHILLSLQATFRVDIDGIDDSYVTNTDEMPDFPDDYEDPGEGEDEPYYIYFIVSESQEVQMEVFRLSEELFNYCKAQYLMNFNMLSNFGLSPPNFTYTNVSGGVGIVGGISSYKTVWFDVPKN